MAHMTISALVYAMCVDLNCIIQHWGLHNLLALEVYAHRAAKAIAISVNAIAAAQWYSATSCY